MTGTESANAVDLLTKAIPNRQQCRFHHGTTIVIESDADQYFGQLSLFTNSQSLSIVPGPESSYGFEPVIADWIPHDTALSNPLMIVGDRYGEVRYVVSKVGGAVERVNDPEMFCGSIALSFFFTQNGMIRKRCLNLLDDTAFGADIGIGYKIGAAWIASLRHHCSSAAELHQQLEQPWQPPHGTV